jgi:hypothetical protein
MDAFLFVGTVLLLGWFVTAPLRWRERAAVEDGQLAALQAARDAKLRELRDAELDFATGKLAREDYELLDSTLRAEAAQVLRRLEEPSGGAA